MLNGPIIHQAAWGPTIWYTSRKEMNGRLLSIKVGTLRPSDAIRSIPLLQSFSTDLWAHHQDIFLLLLWLRETSSSQCVSEGLHMDLHKVYAVQNWPQSMGLKAFSRFLSCTNYWPTFTVLDISHLNSCFFLALVLLHPDPNRHFFLGADAISFGIGAVLS